MYFIEKLIQLIKEKKSVVSMGLDPRMDKEGEIPQYLIEELQTPNNIIREFNKIFYIIPSSKQHCLNSSPKPGHHCREYLQCCPVGRLGSGPSLPWCEGYLREQGG